MRMEELNWMDVENYLKTDNRLIVILGAAEQHGYLSLLTDTLIPQALADAASQKTGVLIAPPLNFGCSPYFLTYPGTASLRVETLTSVVEDIIRSYHGQGFRRILVLNGHGGNTPAQGKLVELSNLLPGLQVAWYAWWLSNSVKDLAMRYQLEPNHANWMEAFPFTRVAALPEQAKLPPPAYKGLLNAERTRQVYGDGNFGGHYIVEESVMRELFDVCLKDILYLLDF